MAALTVTLNNISPALEHKHSEVDFILNALDIVRTELGRGRGNVTSGTIVGVSAAGVANTQLGTWTYTPVASLP
jgi:hypothetical protein